MNRNFLTGFSVFLVLFSNGCERLWDARNLGALKKDVSTLLSRGSASGVVLDCHMAGSTGTGTCEANISLAAAQKMTAALQLIEVGTDGSEDFAFGALARQGSCSEKQKGPDVRIFKSQRKFLLENRGAFEFLLLFHNLRNGDACIQVSSAYG